MVTDNVFVFLILPVPRQVLQVLAYVFPLPLHSGQVDFDKNEPKIVCCSVVIVPLPWHLEQVCSPVPPLPSQSSHSSVTSTFRSFSVPYTASSKESFILTSVSFPFWARLLLLPPPKPKPPPNILPKISPKSTSSKPPKPDE